MSSSGVFHCCVYAIALLFPCAVIAYALYLMNTRQPSQDDPSSSLPGTRVIPSLELLVVVTRHGNRRPLFSFPNEPYSDKYWSCELGEITNQGKREMYNLGRKIRFLYNGFLNNSYSSNDIYATSTALERTLVSGEAFLAGLYPPQGNQIWNEDITWQPIPIFTDSPDGSQIAHYPCPRYVSERMITLAEVDRENFDVIKNVSDYLDKYSGGNSSEAHYLYNVWDSLSTDKIEGFILPDWTKPVYPEPLSSLIGQHFIAMSAGTDKITRIISSALFIHILGLMEGKINGTLSPDYKMNYYSSHDLTIIALQAVLGIPKSSIKALVNPGSALIYELHRNPSSASRSVQVLYIDGLSPDLHPETVNVVGFSQLLNITAKFRNFTSVHDECFDTK